MLFGIKTKLIEEVVKERNKYFSKHAPDNKKGDELVQATAATVGFFSEITHHRAQKKVEREASNDAEYAQAEASAQAPSKDFQVREPGPVPIQKGLAASFLHRHLLPIPDSSQPSQLLTTPVLIPQRRPKNRARGFAPAYAPVLGAFDVSQNAFLDFIITLNASLEPSPYLNAINLASFAGEASPEPLIGFLVGEAVETVTDAIMEAQSRIKSTLFLDKVNEAFFAPRGLLAFVGTWRPSENESDCMTARQVNEYVSATHSQIDVTNSASSEADATGGWRTFQRQVQRAMLPARGDFKDIIPAPLVWPSVEEIAIATPYNQAKRKGRFDRAGLWIDEHIDKHSQVSWTQEHPNYPLADSLPKPEFQSRYADPSHAASSGDVVALLTGGQWHIKEDEKKKEKEVRKRLEKEAKKEKKLLLKAEKERLKEERARAKAESTKEDGIIVTAGNRDSEAEQSKLEVVNDVKTVKKQRNVKAKASSGLSSLLEHNLLYLVVVQRPPIHVSNSGV